MSAHTYKSEFSMSETEVLSLPTPRIEEHVLTELRSSQLQLYHGQGNTLYIRRV